MALITIDRSLFASKTDDADAHDSSSDICDLPESSSRSSKSEDFMTCKGTVIGLNICSKRRSSVIKPNDDIRDHLKKILGLLRFGDYIQLIVLLQCEVFRPHHHRYCCVVSTTGKMGTEESIILGVDITDGRATLGLVLSVWQDMSVSLCGDGGFELITKDREILFKPVSVQALWAAFQAVGRACSVARSNAYFCRGLNHDWVAYYHGLSASTNYQIQEWLKTDDVDILNWRLPLSCLSVDASEEERETVRIKELIRVKLQDIMYTVDLEEVTVLQLRNRLEDDIGQSLRAYRHFIEAEVLRIYGQMDESSEIFPHLLLGTTFNASNKKELERRSVTHILNVTKEVDNFFPGEGYVYKNIRVYDDEQSSLLPYFEDTHRFINEAKAQGNSCLVHCRMGISRSATVVIAYTMKEKNMDLSDALSFVKARRRCIQPNLGFMRELQTYQGILEASSNRYKAIFCQERTPVPGRRSASSLLPCCSSATVTCTGEPSALCMNGVNTLCAPLLPFEADTSEVPLGGQPTGAAAACTSFVFPDGEDVPASFSAGVDLESELFAYKKQRYRPSDHVRCQLADAENSPETLLQNDPAAEFDTAPEVLYLGSVEDEEKLKGVTMVAHNSYCLRQWHPDLVENVTLLDVRPSPACALDRSRSMPRQQPVRPRLSHSTRTGADISGSPPSTDTLEHRTGYGVTCLPPLASWPSQGQQDDSELCCTGGDCEEMAKAEQERETQSQAAPQPSSASSYVLRMVSKLAESCSAQPSTMPGVGIVPYDRAPIIRPTTSGPRKLALQLDEERRNATSAPSSSPSQGSDVLFLSPTSDQLMTNGSPVMVNTTTTSQHDTQTDSHRHPRNSDSSPQRSASLCRSARRVETVESQSGISRSQSDRQTRMIHCKSFNLPCRLRPDNSWILRESNVGETPVEAGCSALFEPPHRLRPQSALSTTTTTAFGVRHSDIDCEDQSEDLPRRVHSLAFGHNHAIPRPLVDNDTYYPVESSTSDPIESVNPPPTTAYSADCTAGSRYSISASNSFLPAYQPMETWPVRSPDLRVVARSSC